MKEKEVKKKIQEAWVLASEQGGVNSWVIKKMLHSLMDGEITKGKLITLLLELKNLKASQEIIDLIEEAKEILENKQGKLFDYLGEGIIYF